MNPRLPVSTLKCELHCLLPQDHPIHLGWTHQTAGTEYNSLHAGPCLAVCMDTSVPLPLGTLPVAVTNEPSQG